MREDGHEVSLFNARETAHMQDVKDRFRIMNKAQEFSVLYALGYIAVVVLWAREVSLRALAMQVAGGAAVCVVVIGIIGAIGAAGFDSAWENFHQLIFSNDFWLLNPATDHLIQIFPPPFWESIVFFMGKLDHRRGDIAGARRPDLHRRQPSPHGAADEAAVRDGVDAPPVAASTTALPRARG